MIHLKPFHHHKGNLIAGLAHVDLKMPALSAFIDILPIIIITAFCTLDLLMGHFLFTFYHLRGVAASVCLTQICLLSVVGVLR